MRACQVIMDEDTKESVKELVFFETLPETRLKGKAEPIPLFAPLKEKPRKQGSAAVARSGRDREYVLLRGMVSELLIYQRESGLIVLIGGRGSGKNVLVQGLEAFGAEAGMVVLRGAAEHEGQAPKARRSVAAPAKAPSEAERGSGLSEPRGDVRGDVVTQVEETPDFEVRKLCLRDVI